MNQKHISRDPSADQILQSLPDTCLYGSWLKLARGAWILLTLLLLGVAIASQPASFATLHQPCTADVSDCNGQGLLTASQLLALHGFGLSLDTYAWSRIVTTDLSALLLFVMGGILFWRRSDDWMVLLVALLFVSLGATNATNALNFSSSLWGMLENAVLLIQSLAILLTLALFPNGRFVPSFTRWIVLVYPANVVFYLVFLNQLHLPGWTLFNNPVNGALWFGCWILLTLAQLYRYFRVSTPIERQQTKWVAFTFLVVLVIGIVGYVTTPTELSVLHNGFLYLLLTNLAPFLVLFFPLSIGIAILRYRLWDIDIIINRTLVYGILTMSVIGIYALVVGTLGALLRVQGNFFIALLGAGLVAVLFQPLRLRLQSGVNRLMYGERDTPDKVISRLGQRLETALAPDAVLPTIVETVAKALKLPYTAITLKSISATNSVLASEAEMQGSTLKQGGAFVPAAVYGQAPKEDLVRLPLVYQNEQIGELLLAPRAPGETFSSADRALLGDLARQAGIAAHAVRLTADLQRAAVELQHSRTQLVTTREEERRRLRRDLHDGLGPALGSLTLQLDTARNLYKSDPTAADELLVDLKAQVQAAIADIRRLVYELRPPTLDELGLITALREQVTRYRKPGLSITLNAPEHLPPLPAAVEVAIYRIAQEALTNVLRHANAQHCELSLEVDNHIYLEIRDDGQGLAADYQVGVGLTSMRERAAELGGTCVIGPVDAGGTRIFIRLPLPKE